MYFPSKKDLWLGIILWGFVLIPLLIYAWKPVINLGLIVPACMVLLFISWIWFKTGYTITDKELVAQEGPFRWKINLENIRKVRRTRSPISSPALSLDRLEIEYSDGKFILISPADTEAFLNILRGRCPKVDIKLD